MGCGCSSEPTPGVNTEFMIESDFERMLTTFHHPEKYTDPFDVFPSLVTLESIQTKSKPGFTLLLCSRTESQHKLDEFLDFWVQKYNDFNHPNLMMIHGISCIGSLAMSVLNYPSVIVPLKKAQLLLDYPEAVLGTHGSLSRQDPMEEGEVWFLLDCLMAAMAYQQGQKVRCSNLTLNEIYQVKTQFGFMVYKISDCFCKPFEDLGYQRLIESERNGNYDKHVQRLVLLAPRQIESLQSKTKYPMQNIYKSQVFVLGLLCLFCMDLQETHQIYEWNRFRINSAIIESRLLQLYRENKASLALLQLLERMLTVDEASRPDLIQINNQITEIYHQAGKQRLLEIFDPVDFLYRDQGTDILVRQDLETKLSLYRRLEQSDFPRNEQPDYNFCIGNMAETLLPNKEHEPPQERERIKSERSASPFEVEKIVTTSVVPNEDFHASKSKASDTFKISHSEITNNQILSRNTQGFFLYPFPVATSKSVQQSPEAGTPRQGKLVYSSGSYYVGQTILSRRSGVGTLFDENGNKLVEGEWEQDMPNGNVVFYNYPIENNQISHHVIDNLQWTKYDGKAKNGYKEGNGILYFFNGDVFDGTFVQDFAEGPGYYQYSKGSYVEGQWHQGQFR